LAQLCGAVRTSRDIEAFRAACRADLVHANSASAAIQCALHLRLGSRRALPMVWHVRDAHLGPETRWLRFIGATAISTSLALTRRLRAQGHRVHFVPNGIQLEMFRAPRRPAPLSTKLRLLMIAHFAGWKQHRLAVETVDVLRRRGVNVSLALVGGTI